MISWDEDFSISRDGHKTSGSGPSGIVNSPGNFNIPLQPPTVTVSAINRIRPCCAPAAKPTNAPVHRAACTEFFLWLQNDTRATHTHTQTQSGPSSTTAGPAARVVSVVKYLRGLTAFKHIKVKHCKSFFNDALAWNGLAATGDCNVAFKVQMHSPYCTKMDVIQSFKKRS